MAGIIGDHQYGVYGLSPLARAPMDSLRPSVEVAAAEVATLARAITSLEDQLTKRQKELDDQLKSIDRYLVMINQLDGLQSELHGDDAPKTLEEVYLVSSVIYQQLRSIVTLLDRLDIQKEF